MKRNEDFFEIIGKVTVFFSTVDLLATELISKFKSIETEPFKLPKETATLGMKIGFIEKIVVTSPQAIAALNHIYENLTFIKEVANERNRYMHDQWIFNQEIIKSGRIERIRLTSSGLKESTSLSYDDLNNFCNEVGKVQSIFAEAMKKAGVKIA